MTYMTHINIYIYICIYEIYKHVIRRPLPTAAGGARQRRGDKRRTKSIAKKSKRQEARASKTWKKKASSEASVLEASWLLACSFGVARLQFGARFFVGAES